MEAELLVDLTLQYGNHDYNYPHLSAVNIKSVINNHNCKTYEELDHWCKRLDQVVEEIERMKETLHG
jgi:hypothetical protein